MHTVYLWLLGAGVTFLMEMGHPGLFLSLSVSIGSLCAAAVAYADFVTAYQLLFFIGTTSGSFLLLQRFVKTYSHSTATNAHALVGAHGIVTAKITPFLPGRVRINGEEWRAKTLHEISLESGSRVRIMRIDRTTVIVSPHHP